MDDEIMGAAPSWIVSVLKEGAGADDASNGRRARISPRIVNMGTEVYLRLRDSRGY